MRFLKPRSNLVAAGWGLKGLDLSIPDELLENGVEILNRAIEALFRRLLWRTLSDESFNQARRKGSIRGRCASGFFAAIVRSTDTMRPHVHGLLFGPWIPIERLKADWAHVLDVRSVNVWVRACPLEMAAIQARVAYIVGRAHNLVVKRHRCLGAWRGKLLGDGGREPSGGRSSNDRRRGTTEGLGVD